MTSDEIALIHRTADYVRDTLTHAEAGHDWWHTRRVWQNAKTIAFREKCDMLVVELSALLHDIADAKFHDGDESVGPAVARQWLTDQRLSSERIEHVINIIRHMSYKNSLEATSFSSSEMLIVQDADRLDAIGAIGIARAFSYGGYKGRVFYDPDVSPILDMTKEQYKNSTAPTINHFYEKLLRLKDLMNTETAKNMAGKRHSFMEQYLEQFYNEWDGK